MPVPFKIKTGLQIGSTSTQIVTSITDSSSFTNDSSTLASVNAIKNYVSANAADESYWTLDGSTLVPKDDSVDVQLNAIQINDDAGAVTIVDMDVSSAAQGTEESYAFNLDGSTMMKVYGVADGNAALQETAIVIEATYQYMGDPNIDGSWRFFIDPSTDLRFEKRISSVWTEAGKFTI